MALTPNMSPEDLVSIVESMHDNFWGGWPTEGEMASFLAGMQVAEYRGRADMLDTTAKQKAVRARWQRMARAVEQRLAEDGVSMDLSCAA